MTMQSEHITNGYILYARAILDSRLWMCGPDALRVATWLLLAARSDRKPKKFPGFTQHRGEVVTSLSLISEGTEWFENRAVHRYSRTKVSRILSQLCKIEFCKPISDTFGTHIKISKYDSYQNPNNYKSDNYETTMKQQRDNSETTADTNNNGKNVKKVKKEIGEKSPTPSFKKWTCEEFIQKLDECIAKLPDDEKAQSLTLREKFINKYTEGWPGKMNFQFEKTWSTSRRLSTWRSNDREWNAGRFAKSVTQNPTEYVSEENWK